MGAELSSKRFSTNSIPLFSVAVVAYIIYIRKIKSQRSVHDSKDVEVQTHVSFTERLREYGDNVGSTEAFDATCDVCQKEALGFCKQCEQYYCFKCCQCHEKTTFSQNHAIVGKKDFTDIPGAQKLFERKIVPANMENILPLRVNEQRPNWFMPPAKSIPETPSIRCLALPKSHESDVISALDHGSSWLRRLTYTDIGKFRKGRCVNSSNIHMIMHISSATECEDLLVTCPDAQQVKKCLSFSNYQFWYTYFNTTGQCWGIAEFEEGYAVSVKIDTGYTLSNWQVQFLNIDGGIKRRIFYDHRNRPLFSRPEYLASNTTKNVLYVSDRGRQAVIALDVLGNVLFKFSHGDMKSPRAMTIDDEDNIYVACGENLVQIHKSGTKHRVLVQKKQGSPDILSVCFNPSTQSLIVGENSNQLKTFIFQ